MPPANPIKSNLAARAISATVLIPTVLAAVWYGGGAFLLMVAISIGLMAVEWGKMSAPDHPAEVAVTITVAVLTGVFAAYTYPDQYWRAWALMAGGCVAAAIASRHRTERAADAGYGVFYIAPACIIMVWLRDPTREEFAWPLGPGVAWTLILFAVTWAADIGAYATGRLVGGPKLWPRISPNKTWSGFFGGLILGTLTGLAVSAVLPSMQVSFRVSALIGFFGAAATMAGDLWESWLKRRFGVKDSGDLIPGHGGLLDRVDGLMFAAVVVGLFRLAVIRGYLS